MRSRRGQCWQKELPYTADTIAESSMTESYRRSELVDALMRFGVQTTQEEADDLFNITDDNSDDLINHTEFKNILYDAVPPATVPLGNLPFSVNCWYL